MPQRAGVAIASKIPALAGKKLLPSMGRIGLESGIAGALSTGAQNPEDITLRGQAERAGEFAAMGAGATPIIKGATSVITGTGRWIAKNIGGITDATVNLIKRIGPERVFDPNKARADYIGKDIVPNVKNRIATSIEKMIPGTRNMLLKLGVPQKEIDLITYLPKESRKIIANVVKGTEKNPDQIISNIEETTKRNYEKMLKSIPDDVVDFKFKNAYYSLKNQLQGMGWLDKVGNPIKSEISNRTRDNLIKIYDELKILNKGQTQINKQTYFKIKNELQGSTSGDNKFDRIIYETQDKLKNDFENSLIAAKELLKKTVPNSGLIIGSLKESNKQYSDMKKLTEITKAFEKLGDEKQPLSVVLEQRLHQLGDPKNFSKRELWKGIMGKSLFDDLEAHFANRDFELVTDVPGAGGGIYPSRSGFMRAATSGITKKYYQSLKPSTQSVKEGLKDTFTPGTMVNTVRGMVKIVGKDKDGHPLVEPVQ
jgi:hypothetical protein